MVHFRDLTDYAYFEGPLRDQGQSRLRVKNVGWLARGHAFESGAPELRTLDALWALCGVFVNETRGLHLCDLCPAPLAPTSVTRGGKTLLLGSAEIRAFSSDGQTFAAPNLIFHYVSVHHYNPPAAFVAALQAMRVPLTGEYFQCLDEAGSTWRLVEPSETEAERPPLDRTIGTDGTTQKDDGTIVLPDGTMIQPDGRIIRN